MSCLTTQYEKRTNVQVQEGLATFNVIKANGFLHHFPKEN